VCVCVCVCVCLCVCKSMDMVILWHKCIKYVHETLKQDLGLKSHRHHETRPGVKVPSALCNKTRS